MGYILLDALQSFERSYECMRGNPIIDYRPLNLSITLYESDVAYNLALCYLRKDCIAEFKEFISLAMEQAEDIERHRVIRELERVKDDDVIVKNDFKLLHVSPFAVYRVSAKVKRAFQSPAIIDERVPTKGM